MAISSAIGLASGLDLEGLISGLMAVEKLPQQRLQTKQTSIGNQISALGQIKSAIATLQQAAKNISTNSALTSYKGALANADIATVTTASGAVSGAYSIEISQLATHHKVMTSPGVDPASGGTLALEIGSKASGSFVAKDGTSPINITIAAGASLADVAKAINDADGGATAAVINGENGPQLVVTSKETGETNQIKITSTIGGLGFDPDNPSAGTGMTQSVAGQNAILKIDGITIANTTSNTVTDAIQGVTLTLTKTNVGEPTQLTISNDTSHMETQLKAFVDAYNSARDTMKRLSQFDASGKNSGVLNGDMTVNNALNQLRSVLSAVPAGTSDAFKTLVDVGIQTDGSGVLKLDTDKLQSVIAKDFSSVAKTVAAYGTAFDAVTTKMNGSDGIIEGRIGNLNSTSNNLKDRIESMGRMMEIIEARYRKQFTALEMLLGSMQTQSSYLSQQLASLNSLN